MSESGLSREQELELHRRLLENDAVAPWEIAEAFFNHLVAILGARNPGIAPDFIQDAATQAYTSLVKNPHSFDPNKSSAPRPLFAYLRMSAQADLRNLLAQEANRQSRLVRLESVELSDDDGKYLGRDDDPSLRLQLYEEAGDAEREIVSPARRGLTEGENRALDLMLQNERRTSEYVKVLGLDAIPIKEQRAEVKRIKDKLKKRLERGNHGGAS